MNGHFVVRWSNKPTASHWHSLGGIVVWASSCLHQWVGGEHRCLIRYLHRRGYPVMQLDSHVVPKTKKYHQQLLDNVEAVLRLLEENRNGK